MGPPTRMFESANVPPFCEAETYFVPDGTCIAVIVAPSRFVPSVLFIVPEMLLVVTCAFKQKGEMSKAKICKIFLHLIGFKFSPKIKVEKIFSSQIPP